MTDRIETRTDADAPYRLLTRSPRGWVVEVRCRGTALRRQPLINKGTAFSPEERIRACIEDWHTSASGGSGART